VLSKHAERGGKIVTKRSSGLPYPDFERKKSQAGKAEEKNQTLEKGKGQPSTHVFPVSVKQIQCTEIGKKRLRGHREPN